MHFYYLIFSLLFFSHALFAKEIIFSGLAAQTLFICDDTAMFDCWYSHGSYCRINVDKSSYVKLEGKQLMIIKGRLASRIKKMLRRCHDNDKPEFRYYYNKNNINCYRTDNISACRLYADDIQEQSEPTRKYKIK